MLRLLVVLLGFQLLWFSTITAISVNDSNFTKNIIYDGIDFFETIEIQEEFSSQTIFERKIFTKPIFVSLNNEFLYEEPSLLDITLDVPRKPPRFSFINQLLDSIS